MAEHDPTGDDHGVHARSATERRQLEGSDGAGVPGFRRRGRDVADPRLVLESTR